MRPPRQRHPRFQVEDALSAHPRLTPTQKAVGKAYAARLGWNWECFPGKKDIADRTGYHPRTIDRATNVLKQLGFLAVVNKGGGRHRSNRYRMMIPDQPTVTASARTNPGKDHQNPGAESGKTPAPDHPNRPPEQTTNRPSTSEESDADQGWFYGPAEAQRLSEDQRTAWAAAVSEALSSRQRFQIEILVDILANKRALVAEEGNDDDVDYLDSLLRELWAAL